MTESIQFSLFMPQTKWVPPARFPEYLLNRGIPIAIDVETYDPNLKVRGPGWRYRDGHIAGLCLADDANQWYFPVAHLGGNNLPYQLVFDFFRDMLKVRRKVFVANGQYDLGWLWYAQILPDNINLWPDFEDVLLNEALLCEDHPQGHSLDAVSVRRLKRHKDETLLKEAADSLSLDAKKDLWKFPSQYVGPYGEGDARNTYDLGLNQQAELDAEDLRRVWEVEQKILPILHLTSRNGIPLNMEEARKLNEEVEIEEAKLRGETHADPWSEDEKTVLLNAGFRLPRTEKGNLSCDKAFLKSIADFEGEVPLNLPAKILRLRTLNRLRKVYIEDAMNWTVSGNVHPEFLQLANDDGGAKSGRMASRNPNFQQIPSRTPLGKRIRRLYYAKDALWGKFDYSSQEPRWQVHYGIHCGYDGAHEACEAFIQGKKLYTFMEENVPGLSYDNAKMLVLAKSYGMGITTLALTLGISQNEAEDLVNKFDRMVPYIAQLAEHTTSVANKKGYLKTILGRKRRFLYWEGSKEAPPVFGYTAAQKRFKGQPIRRAYTYKAFNALIQGTAADQTKKAMLDIWKELKLAPFCQVHDELDYPITSEAQAKQVKRIMETTITPTHCPFVVDVDLGQTWR